MRTSLGLILALAVLLSPALAPAQKKEAEAKPLLRLEAGGATGNVTGLAFGPDGKSLYAAGYDKVVRVWTLNKQGRFELPKDQKFFRVPIGPGPRGAINALAISDNGRWLAVGGLGVLSKGAGFEDVGVAVPRVGGLSPELRQDEGLVYVFDVDQGKLHRTLRGHSGPVMALAFVPTQAGAPPRLVSFARGLRLKKGATKGEEVSEILLWDVNGGKALFDLSTPPDPGLYPRPGMVVYGSRNANDPPRVALASGDKYLRLWDAVKGGRQAEQAEDGWLNSAAVEHPDGKRLLTGSLADVNKWYKGQLRIWDVTGAKPKPQRSVDLLSSDQKSKNFVAPMALTLVPDEGGPARVAVVVAQFTEGGARREDFLELRDLDLKELDPPRRVSLWKGADFLPAVAAAPGGKHVAVAGDRDHSIRVYRTDDLLKGEATAQVLRSAGTTFAKVRFARRVKDKDEVGLILDEAAPRAGVLTFSFSDGKTTAGSKGWTEDAPPGGYDVHKEGQGDAGTLVHVRQNNKQIGSVTVPPDQEVTDHAVLPPDKDRKAALLVLATYFKKLGEPLLEVYRVGAAEPLLRFTGHLGKIRALAVSADGRLVASTSEDQTVCLWRLPDVDQVLSQTGGIRGLAVLPGEKKGELLVAEVDPANPQTRGLVKEKTVILGLAQGGKVAALESPLAFYEAVWAVKPGTKITLRIRDPAGKESDFPVKVGQGTQERFPLLTLFLTADGKDAQRDWVGWHPGGHYEANRREAEKHVGWHFNPAREGEASSFAGIDLYRKRFFTRTLLKYLVAEADLARAMQRINPPPPPPLPALRLSVLIDGLEAERDEHGHVPLRSPQARIQLTTDDFRPQEGDTVAWQVVSVASGPFEEPPLGDLWSGALTWAATAELPKKSGVYPLQTAVYLQARKETVKLPEPVRVRYQPPKPKLEYAGPLHVTVADKVFVLRAKLTPGAEGVPAVVRLQHYFKGQDKALERGLGTYKDKAELLQKVELEPGVNYLTLEARNEPALKGFEKYETETLTLRVVYEKLKPPPAIAPAKVLPVAEGEQPLPLKIQPKQTVMIDVARCRLQGKIEADEPLTQAEWDPGDGKGKRKLGGLSADGKTCVIDEELQLKPGKRTVRFYAKTKKSEPAEESVAVEYRPRLPQVDLTAPGAPEGIFRGVEPTHPAVVEARLRWPPHSFPGLKPKVVVRVRGKPANEEPVPQNDVARAKVLLEPGVNKVEVEVSHGWGGEPARAELLLRYLRPPRVVKWEKPAGGKPFVDLTAEVESAPGLLKDRTLVHVNGVPQGSVEVKVSQAKEKWRWHVHLLRVPLPAEKNDVQLWVENAEGRSPPSEVLKDVLGKPAPTQPRVEILHPRDGGPNLTDVAVDARFRVYSPVPLRRVELWKKDKKLFDVPAPKLAQLTPQGEDRYDFEAKQLVLDWYGNDLRVVAENAVGSDVKTSSVTVLPQPVEVDIACLIVPSQGNKGQAVALLPTFEQGKPHFGLVKQPQVYVHGKVHWASPHYKEQLDDPRLEVRLHVNGFQQPPVKLEPRAPGGKERTFKVPILLDGRKDNHVEVALPGLVMNDKSQRLFSVDCSVPAPKTVVHAVVVAPRGDGHRISDAVRKALQGLGAPASFEVRPPLVVTERDRNQAVLGLLYRIRDKEIMPDMKKKDGFAPHRHLVVVYYQGAETVTSREHFLWMGATRTEADLNRTAVDLKQLEQLFGGMLGAQLVLLDVAPGGAGKSQDASMARPEEKNVGILRHLWKGDPKAAGSGWLLEELPKALPRKEVTGLQALAALLQQHFEKAQKAMPNYPGRYERYLPEWLEVRFPR